MARFHVYTNVQTGEVTTAPFTPEEEAAFDLLALAPVPAKISDRQFFHQLAKMAVITQAEALDAVKTGAVPAAMQAVIDALPTGDARFDAQMLLSGAVEFRRDHPLVAVFAASQGWTSAQVDELFRNAAAL